MVNGANRFAFETAAERDGNPHGGYVPFPTAQEVSLELERVRSRRSFTTTFAMMAGLIVVAFAAAVLVCTYLLPVVRVYGSSMEPALGEGDVVVSVKDSNPAPGDLIAFYCGNNVLVKRVIAGPNSWVDVLTDGTVLVDAVPLQEPYLVQKDAGTLTLEFPFQVPEGSYFVLGDNRGASVDSRNAEVGAVEGDQIIGKLELRVWPLNRFGFLG